jgi:integrase/recombinase XerD
MSTVMAARLHDYLTMRRLLGFKLGRPGELLTDFVAYLDRVGATTITTDVAVAWATRPADADPSWWGLRMSAVRTFARHLASIDPNTEVPPTGILPARTRRAEPFVYSAGDIAALMAATDHIPTPLVAATYRTLIGLLAVTGMRVGEAINLDRADVHNDDAVLVVRRGKFGKSREVPIHRSTVTALQRYAAVRDQYIPRPATPAWFVSSAGTRLNYKHVHRTFHQLTQTAGLQPRSATRRPRPHDLRHTFAITTLLSWYRAGVDVQARLPLLSTYLGHVKPDCTYWYLSATPQLLGLVADRLTPAGPVR